MAKREHVRFVNTPSVDNETKRRAFVGVTLTTRGAQVEVGDVEGRRAVKTYETHSARENTCEVTDTEVREICLLSIFAIRRNITLQLTARRVDLSTKLLERHGHCVSPHDIKTLVREQAYARRLSGKA